jgi:hypothetical protein
MAFYLNKAEHTAGDHRCVECYRGYPAKCRCGGFIHAQFVKESWDHVTDLAFACDVCGDKFEFPGQKPRKKYRFPLRRTIHKRK